MDEFPQNKVGLIRSEKLYTIADKNYMIHTLSFFAISVGGIVPEYILAYAAVNSAPKNMIIDE